MNPAQQLNPSQTTRQTVIPQTSPQGVQVLQTTHVNGQVVTRYRDHPRTWGEFLTFRNGIKTAPVSINAGESATQAVERHLQQHKVVPPKSSTPYGALFTVGGLGLLAWLAFRANNPSFSYSPTMPADPITRGYPSF